MEKLLTIKEAITRRYHTIQEWDKKGLIRVVRTSRGRRRFKKLLKMVMQRKVSKIIIIYPDSSLDLNKDFCSFFGTEIEVINGDAYTSPQKEMVK